MTVCLQRYFSYFCSRPLDKDDKDNFPANNQAPHQLRHDPKHHQHQLRKFLQS